MTARLSGSRIVTRDQLRGFATPPATASYTPVPFAELVDRIESAALASGLTFAAPAADRFRLAVTPAKLFGVADLTAANDFATSIGFRTSHDKTLAVQLSIGEHVFVCDNLVMTGKLAVHQIHGRNMRYQPLEDVLRRAFDEIPAAVEQQARQIEADRSNHISREAGDSRILQAMLGGALNTSVVRFAVSDWHRSYDGDTAVPIEHPQTEWALRQAVTRQWRRSPITQIDTFSQALADAWRN